MVLQVSKHLVTMADFSHSDTTYGRLYTKQTKQMNTYTSQFNHLLPTVKSAVLTHSWSGVLLEKLIGSQLVKKFTAYYAT